MEYFAATVFAPPDPELTSAAVTAAILRAHWPEAVSAIWAVAAKTFSGEVNVRLRQITEWLDALPPEQEKDCRVRYLRAWLLYEQRRNISATLLFDELAAEWTPRLQGARAPEAAAWLMLIRMGQGLIAESEGRWDRARAAYSSVIAYLPEEIRQVAALAATDLEGPEAERMAAQDPVGLSPALSAAFVLFRTGGNRAGLGRVACGLGFHYLNRGTPATARFWLEQALELQRDLPGPFPLASTLICLGRCYQQLGLQGEAQGALDEALCLATSIEHPVLQASALSSLGDVCRDREEFPAALDLYQKALLLQEELRYGYGMARTQLALSVLHRRAGRPGLALDCAVEALTLSQGHGNEAQCAAAALHGQAAALMLGDRTEAAGLPVTADRLAALQVPGEEALARWYLAVSEYRAGDLTAARESLRRSLALATRHRNLHSLALELPVTAEVCRVVAHPSQGMELIAGLVQRTTPRGLLALLQDVPEARAMVAETGRMPETTALSVQLLGTFRVARAGREIDLSAARSQKAVSLFKFLVAKRGRPSAREQILEAIWPEAGPDSADRSFEVTLSTLRRLLDPEGGPSVIIRRGRCYMVNPDVPLALDVDRFTDHLAKGRWWWQRGQSALAIAEWEAAEAAYGGDFLADDPYEDWAAGERERLREQYLDLLLRLGEQLLGQGRPAEAVERAYRVLRSDPIREAAYRLLMQAHARQGNRAVAMRDLQRCSAVLQQELGEEPMPETRELARRIRTGDIR